MNLDSPAPHIEAAFSCDPHPDPTVQALIEEVTRLRAANATLRRELDALGEGLGYGSHPR
jgi:hypothetical protein